MDLDPNQPASISGQAKQKFVNNRVVEPESKMGAKLVLAVVGIFGKERRNLIQVAPAGN